MSCRTRAAIAIIRDFLSRFMVLSSHCDAVLISAGFLTLNFGYCKVSERYHEPLTSIWRKPTEKSRAFPKNLPAGFFPPPGAISHGWSEHPTGNEFALCYNQGEALVEISAVTVPTWLVGALSAGFLILGAAIVWRLAGRLRLLQIGKSVKLWFDPDRTH